MTAKIERSEIIFKDGEDPVKVLTMFKESYMLWPDPRMGPDGFRWSRRHWHDDGMGMPTHGAEYSLQAASQAIVENERLWQDHRKARLEVGGTPEEVSKAVLVWMRRQVGDNAQRFVEALNKGVNALPA